MNKYPLPLADKFKNKNVGTKNVHRKQLQIGLAVINVVTNDNFLTVFSTWLGVPPSNQGIYS